MAIGEFEEVGNVVRSFAADDATVVVGTAIDESLEGELHVTVVATGLGQQSQSQAIRGVRAQQQQQAAGGSMQATGTGGVGGGARQGYSVPPSAGQQTYGGAPTSAGGRPYTPAPPHAYGNGNSAGPNYDKPQVVRKTAQGSAASSGIPSAGGSGEHDYLDIPAFLRRQAD